MAKKENDLKKITESLIQDFLTQLGLDAEITIGDPVNTTESGDFSYLNVTLTAENLGELIGFRGNMLDSIQTILGLILTKTLSKEDVTEKYRIILDINDYRKQRADYLVSYALRAVDEVLNSGQPMELSPMKPSERRIVHMALKETKGIFTSSAGEGENRRVVISPKSK
ncbi:MAG TPA: R3H domain-containing nucleic acid-binding protein [Candidatus Dojkabacteria bacterium]|nr:R3H domain-containing nucleic acid-binding protein [Candidatus Dojkabacteria bacterium]